MFVVTPHLNGRDFGVNQRRKFRPLFLFGQLLYEKNTGEFAVKQAGGGTRKGFRRRGMGG